jgi:hypothetical protein
MKIRIIKENRRLTESTEKEIVTLDDGIGVYYKDSWGGEGFLIFRHDDWVNGMSVKQIYEGFGKIKEALSHYSALEDYEPLKPDKLESEVSISYGGGDPIFDKTYYLSVPVRKKSEARSEQEEEEDETII